MRELTRVAQMPSHSPVQLPVPSVCAGVTAPYTLLFDQPLGSALLSLLHPQDAGWAAMQIVVTCNCAAPYLEDLWALGPHALAAGLDEGELPEFLECACRFHRHRRTPTSQAEPLTHQERQLLQRIACGQETKVIARDLLLSDRTVANSLTRIFSKLGVQNRTQAALAYWGIRTTPF